MAEIDVTEVLRPGLLEGVSIALAHAGAAGFAQGPKLESATAGAIGSSCAGLGAVVHECPLLCSGQPEVDDAVVDQALAAMPADAAALRMLVVDAGGLFARLRAGGAADGAGDGARGLARADALIATLEASWRVTRAVANATFIAGEEGGRIVYVAPPCGAPSEEQHAEAARAGLENLARTLSIEWARYGIAPVAIAPGPGTTPGELAGIVAYLASPAGDYFSGCQLDLRGVGASA